MVNQISSFVKEALSLKKCSHSATQSLFWGSVNFTFFVVFAINLHSTSYTNDTRLFWWSMLGACCVCILNMIVHIKSYLAIILSLSPMEVSDKQRKLLAVSENDSWFKSLSQTKSSMLKSPEKHPSMSELYNATIRTNQSLNSSTGLNTSMKSWYGQDTSINSPLSCSQGPYTSHFNTSISPVASTSQMNMSNCSSMSADSWAYHRHSSFLNGSYNILTSPKSGDMSASFSDAHRLNLSSSRYDNQKKLGLSPESPSNAHLLQSITTEKELEEYLNLIKEKERKAQILAQAKNTNGNNSLWSFGGSANLEQEYLNGLRKNIYQPAVKDSGPEAISARNQSEDNIANTSSTAVSKIWVKRNVTQKQLFQYEENLRIWISMNILQPIVKMIDVCNETLSATAPELRIGDVGIDKLKKAALNISGVKQLNNLLPFLDMTLHQDYLVQRLRELSKGGAISTYQWNAGGKFKGRPWRDELPTDTFILFHLFAIYMDAHLPPDPTQADGRVFSNLHLVKTPEKPANPAIHPSLYLCQINPPHVKVSLPGQEDCDVGSGHKNFLHSLLLFCHHLVYEEHSLIAGVDLRLSGINLAWVLNAD